MKPDLIEKAAENIIERFDALIAGFSAQRTGMPVTSLPPTGKAFGLNCRSRLYPAGKRTNRV